MEELPGVKELVLYMTTDGTLFADKVDAQKGQRDVYLKAALDFYHNKSGCLAGDDLDGSLKTAMLARPDWLLRILDQHGEELREIERDPAEYIKKHGLRIDECSTARRLTGPDGLCSVSVLQVWPSGKYRRPGDYAMRGESHGQ